MQERETNCSRIPRLVRRPYLPKLKVSPSAKTHVSGESKDFTMISSESGMTSSNSFCSDDTGCPSSGPASPVKTPSDAGKSPVSFCEDERKKTAVYTRQNGNKHPDRYKKEKTGVPKTGSEADFSSSSSMGSISASVHKPAVSGGKKTSRNRVRRHAGKPAHSPPTSHKKDCVLVLCSSRLSPVNVHIAYENSTGKSSKSGPNKGSDTSHSLRRNVRYTSCAGNHGILPPSPENYLTPLQQKELSIRHLSAKLSESRNALSERETEIKNLKAQLARMRDDWVEEECHRVEIQLTLKEAHKEIKQLKQFVENMKDSLAENDKGIQKHLIDINIQNQKLESLIRRMEQTQDGELREEPCLDRVCSSPGVSQTESAMCDISSEEIQLEVTEEMTDSDLLLNDDLTNQDDQYDDDDLMETKSDLGSLTNLNSILEVSVHIEKDNEKENSTLAQASLSMEQAIQTDVVPYSLHLDNLILKIFKSPHNLNLIGQPYHTLHGAQLAYSGDATNVIDLTPDDSNSAILISSDSLQNALHPMANSNRAMTELDFYGPSPQSFCKDTDQTCVSKTHWNPNYITDLLAVAVPIIPSVVWAFGSRRGDPERVYNIGTMMRGCCLIALNTLRKTSHSPHI